MAGASAAKAVADPVVVDAATRFAPATPAAQIGAVDDRRSQDRDDDSNRRRSPRRRVLLAATLETAVGIHDVKLRNISSTGALLDCAAPPATGARVTFRRANMAIAAQVMWASAGACGIHFDSPIKETELLIQIGKPAAPC
jgi:hypothetical protein